MIDHWVATMTSARLRMVTTAATTAILMMMVSMSTATANTACTTRATASTAVADGVAGWIQAASQVDSTSNAVQL